MKKTIIIGLGNPILTDDGVGIYIARRLSDILQGVDAIDVTELYAGGIRLLDALSGYEEAIVIDAMVTGGCAAGDIACFTPDEAVGTRNTLSVHDMDLSTALRFGRTVGMPLPERITVWGIEAKDVETFSERLTGVVADAVPRVVRQIVKDLTGTGGTRFRGPGNDGAPFRAGYGSDQP